jgi:hypothetical protein
MDILSCRPKKYNLSATNLSLEVDFLGSQSRPAHENHSNRSHGISQCNEEWHLMRIERSTTWTGIALHREKGKRGSV